MFTGIIEELGKVTSVEPRGGGVRIRIGARTVLAGTAEGDSISVNGVCLTVVALDQHAFAADCSRETLDRSTLASLRPGTPVNLERAVTPATRLGGHIVQGHVDARGSFVGAKEERGFWTVNIGFPVEVARYLVFKGSVSVEGISLTVAALHATQFDVAVIPKTWEVTNLSSLRVGAPVNLEVDIIAKYVERMMNLAAPAKADIASGITRARLRKLGYE